MTPITKNGSELIRVFDVHGNELEATYPKRAKGLVRKGRAQWLGSVNHDDPDFVPDSIILYDEEPADHSERTADIQQTEVQSMLFFNTNNEPDTDNTNEIPTEATEAPETTEAPQSEIDPAVQKMIDDFKIVMSKARADMAKMQDEENSTFAEARRMKAEAESAFDTALEEDEYSGVTFPDFGEIPEVPDTASASQTDFTEVLTEILDMLDDIGERELSGDPDIAAIETNHLAALSENLREVYSQTLSAMEQIRKEAAQIAVYNRRQQLLEGRIAKLEEDKTCQIKTLGKLFADGLISADQMIGEMGSTTRFYNDEINKLIAMMN